MAWILIFFISTVAGLQPWNVSHSQFDYMEDLDFTRVKRQGLEKMLEKFPERKVAGCELLHQTDEAPFAAIILYKTSGRFLCMGSIVDNKHVLTAKRCFDRTEVSDLLVLVGYYKPYWGKGAQVKKVKRIVRHEYQLALLRLDSPIDFTPYVQPIRLPSSASKGVSDFQSTFPPPYKLVGFMVDRYNVPGDFIQKDHIYNMKQDGIVPFDTCMQNYTKIVLDSNKLFCTSGNATYCWGGIGAPVLKWIENNYYLQVGVVVANNCTTDYTAPLLAARTDAAGDWIRGNSFHAHRPS